MKHTFTLYAPTLDAVACGCSAWLNDVKPMMRGENGTWTLDADLPAGTHQYAFRVHSRSRFQEGKTVDVADPMARWLAADRCVSTVTLPVPPNADDYVWDATANVLPDHAHLAIYEMFILLTGDDAAGTFTSAISRLDHIADLGFTAIELLPVSTSDQTQGWGYTPLLFAAVDPRYGSETDLCRFVDAAHARGLAVILDFVVNHASVDCPWAHIDHDCFFHAEPKDPAAAWGPQFDYARQLPESGEQPARHLIKQVIAQWVCRFHLDGLRYDAIAQIRDRDVLPELTQSARTCSGGKPFVAIAECIPVELAIVGPGGPLDLCWRDNFAHDVRRLLTGTWDGSAIEACIDCRKDGFTSGKNVVNYLASHDTGHTVRHLLDAGLDEATALARMRLGLVLVFTALGIPMVWMGDEFGCALDADQASPALPWQVTTTDATRRELLTLTQTLLRLRREHGALREDYCTVLLRDDLEGLLIFHRWDTAGGRVIVVLHGAVGQTVGRIAAPAAGRWREHTVGGEQDTDEAGNLVFTLNGWEAQVWTYG